MSEALNLLVGFSTGEVTMEGENMKHLPTISESLETILETPKRKNIDGSANRTKKAKIAQKVPRKGLAIQHPRTKVPNSEIKLENIIRGSLLLASQSAKIPRGKGKGNKGVRLNDSSFASGMAHQKKTLTAKQRLQRARKATGAAKTALPKPRQSPSAGKAPQKPLATKAPRKQGGGQGVKTKPCKNYAMAA